MPACSQYQPLALDDVPQWDFVTEVAIIGFGATGACAAIEAAGVGASVMLFERSSGSGGASALSGGETQSFPKRRNAVINNMLTIVVSPKRLGTEGSYFAEIERFVAWALDEANRDVLLPGDPEAASRAAAQHAIGVLDLAAGRGLHEGQIETTDIRMRFRERVEHAIPGFDLTAFAAPQRLRFVTERVELFGECGGDCLRIVAVADDLRGRFPEFGADPDEHRLHGAWTATRI